MLKNVQKRGGTLPNLLNFLHPLQEPFSLQNYIPTSVSDGALPQRRHPTSTTTAGLQPPLGAMGCQTWDLVLGSKEGSPAG